MRLHTSGNKLQTSCDKNCWMNFDLPYSVIMHKHKGCNEYSQFRRMYTARDKLDILKR